MFAARGTWAVAALLLCVISRGASALASAGDGGAVLMPNSVDAPGAQAPAIDPQEEVVPEVTPPDDPDATSIGDGGAEVAPSADAGDMAPTAKLPVVVTAGFCQEVLAGLPDAGCKEPRGDVITQCKERLPSFVQVAGKLCPNLILFLHNGGLPANKLHSVTYVDLPPDIPTTLTVDPPTVDNPCGAGADPCADAGATGAAASWGGWRDREQAARRVASLPPGVTTGLAGPVDQGSPLWQQFEGPKKPRPKPRPKPPPPPPPPKRCDGPPRINNMDTSTRCGKGSSTESGERCAFLCRSGYAPTSTIPCRDGVWDYSGEPHPACEPTAEALHVAATAERVREDLHSVVKQLEGAVQRQPLLQHHLHQIATAQGRLRAVLMKEEAAENSHDEDIEALEHMPGLAGPPGPPGAPGLRGRPGLLGPVGDVGEPGAAGARGEPGPQGVHGEEAGEPGEDGEEGEPGDAGPEGDAGTPGTPGPAGRPGRDGAAGERGEPGQRGARGADGASPVGEPGERGATGPPGPPGMEGDEGSRGDRGPAGEEGVDGMHGKVNPADPAGAFERPEGWQPPKEKEKEPWSPNWGPQKYDYHAVNRRTYGEGYDARRAVRSMVEEGQGGNATDDTPDVVEMQPATNSGATGGASLNDTAPDLSLTVKELGGTGGAGAKSKFDSKWEQALRRAEEAAPDGLDVGVAGAGGDDAAASSLIQVAGGAVKSPAAMVSATGWGGLLSAVAALALAIEFAVLLSL